MTHDRDPLRRALERRGWQVWPKLDHAVCPHGRAFTNHGSRRPARCGCSFRRALAEAMREVGR